MGKQGRTAMPLIILMWKNRLAKVHRIHENDAQNLQVTCAEFSSFWRRILTTLVNINMVEAANTIQ